MGPSDSPKCSARGQLWGQGQAALLLQGLGRGRACERLNQLSRPLRFQREWFLLTPVVTRAMDIITDPSFSKNTDPYMSFGPDVTVAPVAAQTTHISKVPVAARPSHTSMISGGSPDPRHHTAAHGNSSYRHQPRPWLPLDHELRHGHGSSLGPDDTMTSGGSVGHSDRHVP